MQKKATLSQRRRNTIEFFFEQKAEEFEATSLDMASRMRALQDEHRQNQANTLDEIVDFLSLLAGGGESPEAREVMRVYRKFLSELGVSDADVIKACKGRG